LEKLAKGLFVKHRELIVYGVVGVAVTVLNIVLFWLFETTIELHYLAANGLAWVLSFIAAFYGNKYIVFRSTSSQAKRFFYELLTFFAARVISGALDMAIMFAGVDVISVNELAVKVFDNVVVIVFNYIAAKLVIFKKKKEDA
jgi:putative flippase GtrA